MANQLVPRPPWTFSICAAQHLRLRKGIAYARCDSLLVPVHMHNDLDWARQTAVNTLQRLQALVGTLERRDYSTDRNSRLRVGLYHRHRIAPLLKRARCKMPANC